MLRPLPWLALTFVLCRVLPCWSASPPSDAPLEWQFDQSRDLAGATNFDVGRARPGEIAGEVQWDPYFALRLPREGIDAR